MFEKVERYMRVRGLSERSIHDVMNNLRTLRNKHKITGIEEIEALRLMQKTKGNYRYAYGIYLETQLAVKEER